MSTPHDQRTVPVTNTSGIAPAADNDLIPRGRTTEEYEAWLDARETGLAKAKARLAERKERRAVGADDWFGPSIEDEEAQLAGEEGRLARDRARHAARPAPPGPPHCYGTEALDQGDPDQVITWWWAAQYGSDRNMYPPMPRREVKAMVDRIRTSLCRLTG